MRSRKAFLNLLTKIIYQIAALISGLITPRLIISCFGSSYNGTISSITKFLGVISFLTLGVAGATRVALYGAIATQDGNAISRIMKATEKYMRKVGIVLLMYALVLAIVFPFISKSEIPQFEVALLVCLVAAGTFSQYYFGQTYSFLLQADQREYVVTIIRTIACIIDVVIVLILTSIHATMIELRIGLAAVSVMIPIMIHFYVAKKYKIDKNCPPDMNALSQRKHAMYHSIANIVHDNAPILLLTVFLGPISVSVYTLYNGIVGNIKQLALNFTAGLEGAFGNMWAKGEKAWFSRSFQTYEFLMFAFSSVIFTSLGLLLIPFMDIYTRGITDANYVLPFYAALVTITEAVFCLRQPYVIIVQAAGKYKETRNGALAEAIINIAVSLVCINMLGMTGVVIGTLVANTFRTLQYAMYSCKYLLNRDLRVLWGRFLWHGLNTVVTILIYKVLMKWIRLPEEWSGWIVSGIICVFIATVVTLISSMIFYRKDLKALFNIISKMVPLHMKKKKSAANSDD